jgi:hypothetical protein
MYTVDNCYMADAYAGDQAELLAQLQAAAAIISRGGTPGAGVVPPWKRSSSFFEHGENSNSPRIKRSKLGTVCNMVEGLKTVQQHENEVAEVVIVCEPEHSSLMMGGLHPRGSLYERPVNVDVAKAQHAEFRNQVWGQADSVRPLWCGTTTWGRERSMQRCIAARRHTP